MLSEFEKQLLADVPDIRNYRLYLAISGGKDSMVLSYLLRKLNLDHTLLHCNFQLRGKESDEDEKFLLTYAKTYDLQIEIKRFDTYEIAEDKNQTIQVTARKLRYDWFKSFAIDNQTLILTAHHLDDSIETFFINLLRGTGIKGISGIPKFNWPYYRPLLSFTSDKIFNFIDEQGIDYKEDSTNAELKYLRNRLRHSLLPQLLELEPSFNSKMKSFFSEVDFANSFLQKTADEALQNLVKKNDQGKFIYVNKLKELNPLILQMALSQFGIKRTNFNSFLEFSKSQSGAIFKTETNKFSLDRDLIYILGNSRKSSNFSLRIEDFPANVDSDSGILTFDIVPVQNLLLKNNPIQLDLNKIELPVTVRTWNHGDKITPLGMSNKKLISDVLIDRKVPQFRKDMILVIEDANENIIGIPGLMINEFFKSDQLTKSLLQITLTEPKN